MGLGQGTILTADQMRDALRKSNMTNRGTNTWSDAYGSVEAQKQDALGQLGNQYSEELLDAYVASQRQASAIQASNLFQGYKDLALDENRALLDQAFEQSRNTLLQKSAQVEQASAEQMDSIDYALNTQATNQAKLYQYALEYLPYLYSKDSTLFDNDPNFNRFLVDDGQGGTSLMTTEEITAKMFTENAEGELELNDFGTDFLDMIEGYDITSKGYSFGDFLAEKDSDLFNWSMSIDPYNYGKTNAGTYKQITGDRKDVAYDYKPNPAEFGETVMTKKLNTQYDALVTKFNKKPTNRDEALSIMDDIKVAQKSLLAYAGSISDPNIKALADSTIANFDKLYKELEDDWHGNKDLAHITSSALRAYQDLYNKITKQGKTVTEVTKSKEQRKAERLSNPYTHTYTDNTPEAIKNLELPDNGFTRAFDETVQNIKNITWDDIKGLFNEWLGIKK